MKLYVASSWRNELQPSVVADLRAAGHEVYDFRHPSAEDSGFSWGDIAANWQGWTPKQFIEALGSPIAERGFNSDFNAMQWADGCVLALPCNRSAHLEAGWFLGQGKPTFILIPPNYPEPELMYRMCGLDRLCTSMSELLSALAGVSFTADVS